jgi:hypothetical protein
MTGLALLLGIALAIIVATRPAEKLLFTATLKIVVVLLCSIFGGLHRFYRNALTGYGVVSHRAGVRLRNNCHDLRSGWKCDPQDEGQKVGPSSLEMASSSGELDREQLDRKKTPYRRDAKQNKTQFIEKFGDQFLFK